MKTIAILSFSNLASDPRVNRQIRFLAPHYKIIAIGESDPSIEGVQFIRIDKPKSTVFKQLGSLYRLLTRQYDNFYWNSNLMQYCLFLLKEVRADLIIANDILTLPLALKIAKGAKVLFDAHEYSPLEYEDLFLWRMLFQKYNWHLCANYIDQCDEMTTVCQGLANEYKNQFGVNPHILTNAPYYSSFSPTDSQNGKIRMIYHGAAVPSRKLENIISTMQFLDNRFSLDLMLVSNAPSYLKKIQALAKGEPKIRFLPPVKLEEIVPFTNQYDLGIFLLEPVNFNYYHALPNKLFEFIQARLAVAVGPSPEMAQIVRKYDCGIVSDDFTPRSFANKLQALTTDKLTYYKSRSDFAAQELNAENNQKIILKLVQQLLEK